MSLSDAMGAAGLTLFAEVGLVISLVAFLGVVICTYLRRNRRAQDEAARLPLADDAPLRQHEDLTHD